MSCGSSGCSAGRGGVGRRVVRSRSRRGGGRLRGFLGEWCRRMLDLRQALWGAVWCAGESRHPSARAPRPRTEATPPAAVPAVSASASAAEAAGRRAPGSSRGGGAGGRAAADGWACAPFRIGAHGGPFSNSRAGIVVFAVERGCDEGIPAGNRNPLFPPLMHCRAQEGEGRPDFEGGGSACSAHHCPVHEARSSAFGTRSGRVRMRSEQGMAWSEGFLGGGWW